MMRNFLDESDIGKSFDIYEKDNIDSIYGRVIGHGILSQVGLYDEEYQDGEFEMYEFIDFAYDYDEGERHCFRTSFGYDYDEGRRHTFTTTLGGLYELYNFMEVEKRERKRRKINPQLKKELQRRVFTRKHGRQVNELTNLPLDVRRNIFTHLYRSPSNGGNKKRKTKTKTNKRRK
jgi:hypothetical protein